MIAWLIKQKFKSVFQLKKTLKEGEKSVISFYGRFWSLQNNFDQMDELFDLIKLTGL